MRPWLPTAVVLLCFTPAVAQQMHGTPMGQGMPMGGAPAANETASTKGYRDAMATMDKAMDIPYTGNADKDFVAGMIPHHQGAIDMARVQLQYGKDASLNKLARGIIAAQVKEIAFMRQWQAKHAP